MWLYLTDSKTFAKPWALELFDRCKRWHALPQQGGVYDQDDGLMAAMEHANGVRWLHDAGLKEIAKHNLGKDQKQLRQAAVRFIAAHNEATNHDHAQPGTTATS